MFRIDLLPAERGDCLWVTWGDAGEHAMLIDGGPSQSLGTLVPELERRLAALPGATDRVELLVQTHLDADHIQGIVSLLSDPARVPLFRDVWFNGLRHVRDVLGASEGELLTAALAAHPDRWNAAFAGGAVVVPDAPAPLPVVELAGGLRLTLLAPTRAALAALAQGWEAYVAKLVAPPTVPKRWRRRDVLGAFDPDLWAGAPFSEDRSKPNGSGIAFVAEYGRRRVLFAADVPPRFLLAAFDRTPASWRDRSGRLRFDAIKMSHHGSRNNTSPAFCAAVSCPRWLVSTDGAQFGHPHPEALARVIASQPTPPTFVLNHVTPLVGDLIEGAGERYRVRTPTRRNGTYARGVSIAL